MKFKFTPPAKFEQKQDPMEAVAFAARDLAFHEVGASLLVSDVPAELVGLSTDEFRRRLENHGLSSYISYEVNYGDSYRTPESYRITRLPDHPDRPRIESGYDDGCGFPGSGFPR